MALVIAMAALTFFSFSAVAGSKAKDVELFSEVAQEIEELKQELAQEEKDRDEEIKAYKQLLVKNKQRKRRKRKSVRRGIASQ